jgi:dolichol-phosphate mannosyltransferase
MRFLVTMPVYNEARYAPRVLQAIRRHVARAADILVVDDGSTDGTSDLLRREMDIRVIRHPENRGYGQSLIDAFAFAAREGYDWAITIDCDEQHEPAQIPEFIQAAAQNDADVISGSRYLIDYPGDDPAPAERRRINHTINHLLDQVLGLKLTDSFCGFKAHRVAAMERLRLTEPGYAFPMQFWPQAVAAHLRIRELPVRRIYRDKNRSFGGTLDDPAERLTHYLSVFVHELERVTVAPVSPVAAACTCQPND